jgi:F-type H+-transporting ATPase subunit gamma
MPGGGAVRAIRQRIRSVQNTAKVTKAMELVASSKMRRAQTRAFGARPYAQQMRAVLAQLAGYAASAEDASPLLVTRPVKHFAFIHITADRGLAGGLNANMNRAGASLALEHQPHVERVSVIPVGRKGRDFFRRSGFPRLAEFTALGDYPGFEAVRPIARLVIEDYTRGEIDRLFIGYQQFVNTAIQRPTLRQLLPVAAPEGGAGATDFIFEPSPEALLESAASEQSARMVAMRSATDAALDMVQGLTLTYNKARQEMITGELLDIVGGKAALEQGA